MRESRRCRCGTFPDEWVHGAEAGAAKGMWVQPPPYDFESEECGGCRRAKALREQLKKQGVDTESVTLRPVPTLPELD